MNNNKLIIQMLPDYIRGQLTEEEKSLVEKELGRSDTLRTEKEKTEQYLRRLESLETEKIKDDFLDRVHQKIETKKRTFFFGLPKISLEITGLIVAVSLIVVIYNPFSEHSITRSTSYITKEFTEASPAPQAPVKTMAEPEIVKETKTEEVKKEPELESDKKNKQVKKAPRHVSGTVSKPTPAPVSKVESSIAPAAELQSPTVEKSGSDNDRAEERLSSATLPMAKSSASDIHMVPTVKTVSLQWSINNHFAGELSSAPVAAPQEMSKVAKTRRSSRKENAARVEMEMSSDEKRDLTTENEMLQDVYLLNVIESCGGTYRKIEENGNFVYRITIHSSKMGQFIAKLQLKGTVTGMVQDAADDQDINYTIELRVQ